MLGPRIAAFGAALAAALFIGYAHPLGQAPLPATGRSIAIAGADDTLPAALERVDALLRDGQLDIVGTHASNPARVTCVPCGNPIELEVVWDPARANPEAARAWTQGDFHRVETIYEHTLEQHPSDFR